LQRPGLQRILEGVRSGEIGSVVILKLDRLTRSTRDLADLLELFAKHEVALVSVCEHIDTQTAGGRMLTNFLGVVSQWEREAIGERTAFALAHKRKNGQVYGRTPFGYRREGDRLVAIPEALAALDKARSMDEAGVSLRKIAAMFEKRGIRPRGLKWYPASVRAVLESKMARESAA
jgi:DNA invertase Pin-like site-specific DNA recombinase